MPCPQIHALLTWQASSPCQVRSDAPNPQIRSQFDYITPSVYSANGELDGEAASFAPVPPIWIFFVSSVEATEVPRMIRRPQSQGDLGAEGAVVGGGHVNRLSLIAGFFYPNDTRIGDALQERAPICSISRGQGSRIGQVGLRLACTKSSSVVRWHYRHATACDDENPSRDHIRKLRPDRAHQHEAPFQTKVVSRDKPLCLIFRPDNPSRMGVGFT